MKFAVRDPIRKVEHDKKTGRNQEVETDPGVLDKRLLVVESEFSQVLRQATRAGNTLSATIRASWDSGDLMTLTKNDPVTATGAHVAVIGHITADELRAELTATDSANGFANRFLFMCAKRSKSLPFGGKPLSDGTLIEIVARIERAVMLARTKRAVEMTAAARATWERVYEALSEGQPGLFGAVTARGEAQCLRLALNFALAECADAIDQPHLLGAIAVWERSQESARHIFGSALGDPMADDILRALRGRGQMTRTDIRDLLHRHGKPERVGAALDLLARRKLATSSFVPSNGGRPSEIWRAS